MKWLHEVSQQMTIIYVAHYKQPDDVLLMLNDVTASPMITCVINILSRRKVNTRFRLQRNAAV